MSGGAVKGFDGGFDLTKPPLPDPWGQEVAMVDARGAIDPRQLPSVRDRMVHALLDQESILRRATQPEAHIGFDVAGSALEHAELYWASPDMVALAVAAGGTLPELDWSSAAMPAPAGLIVLDGGAGMIEHKAGRMPVDAISWSTAGPGECFAVTWTARKRAEAVLGQLRRAGVDMNLMMPPLWPGVAWLVPAEDGGPDGLPLPGRTVLRTLAAAWALMMQPNLVESGEAPVKPKVRRAYGRQRRPVPKVRVVDVRRRYVPEQGATGPGQGRTYEHRWVVRGHWRRQPYGPGREQRRQQWIPSHVKGPGDAPLLLTEKVNVWKE